MLRQALFAMQQQEFNERVDDLRAQLEHLPQEQAAAAAQLSAIYRDRDDGKWLSVRDSAGQWLYRSPRMLPVGSMLPGMHGQDVTRSVSGAHQGSSSGANPGLHYVRLVSSSFTSRGHVYVAVLGASLNKQELLLRRFALGLFLLTPAVLFAAGLAGHLISRRALDPVTLLAQEARRIHDKNLSQRLPVSAADDELAHLALTLNNMLERIDASFRSVRDFSANASHELRTPLALLRTEMDLALLRPRSAAEYQDTLLHMQTVALDMTEMLDTLLALARGDAGTQSLRLLPLDVTSLLRSVVEEWRPIAVQLGLHLQEAFPTTAHLTALADRKSLLRLLRILLDNACKFTPRGGTVSVIAEAAAGAVHLAVQDTGVGIAPAEHQRIFERFYSVGADTVQQRRGAGLGLSLASAIASQHGSSITVTSARGSGARFELVLQAPTPEDLASANLPAVAHSFLGTRGSLAAEGPPVAYEEVHR